MRYLSVCSGIEAATVAWHPLGWEPMAFSEIEPFPSAVLAHHYPTVPNLGDMTFFRDWPDGFGFGYNLAPDLLVGGTPCQSFSVAGLRKGLDDPRGNLALVFLGIAECYRPRWIVWENVPGVLSSSGGRDFGAFLGALGALGYGWAYRVLDAQYFGLAQRRKRVFVVGYLGDWRRAAAVLLEPESLCGDPPTRGQAGEGTTRSVAQSFGASGRGFSRVGDPRGQDCVIPVAHALRADGFDASEDGTGRGTPLIAFSSKDDGQGAATDLAPTLRAMPHNGSHANGGGQVAVASAMAVRRLTPRECERLQGFPDDYTLIPFRKKDATDGPRYKALGNSMAVPVVRWIGERIAFVDAL